MQVFEIEHLIIRYFRLIGCIISDGIEWLSRGQFASSFTLLDPMNVHFHTSHLCLSEPVKQYALRRLACSLGRSRDKVVRVDFHFSGDEASKDTGCRVRLQLQHGQAEISAHETLADIYWATDRAITRATRSLERQTLVQSQLLRRHAD